MVMVLERANNSFPLGSVFAHLRQGVAILLILIFFNMQKEEITLDQAIQPVVECKINFREQRMLLNEMFASTVSNAPDDESDNWTAKRITPFYLALCQLLENIDSIDDAHSTNVLFSQAS